MKTTKTDKTTAAPTHTPGPWTADGLGSESSTSRMIHNGPGPDSRIIATTQERWGAPKESAIADANARLIAAAPDMKDELADILDGLDAAKRNGFDGFHIKAGSKAHERIAAILRATEGK